jgi:hypothetical protein
MLLGLELVSFPLTPARPRPAAQPAAPAIDPRLILYPHAERLAGALAGGVLLTGLLRPDLPGPNTLILDLHGPAWTPPAGAPLRLVATMPGMAMAPATAMLSRRGRDYRGRLVLPMFGRYRVSIVAETPARRYTGTFNLALAWPAR